jgi:hypothetical protein
MVYNNVNIFRDWWLEIQPETDCVGFSFGTLQNAPAPIMKCVWCYRSVCTKQVMHTGRTMDQAISRWLPTETNQVRVHVRSCGICGGQSATGAGSLRILRFPLSIIPSTAPHSSSTIRGWYVPSGLTLTPPKKIKKKTYADLPTSKASWIVWDMNFKGDFYWNLCVFSHSLQANSKVRPTLDQERFILNPLLFWHLSVIPQFTKLTGS